MHFEGPVLSHNVRRGEERRGQERRGDERRGGEEKRETTWQDSTCAEVLLAA